MEASLSLFFFCVNGWCVCRFGTVQSFTCSTHSTAKVDQTDDARCQPSHMDTPAYTHHDGPPRGPSGQDYHWRSLVIFMERSPHIREHFICVVQKDENTNQYRLVFIVEILLKKFAEGVVVCTLALFSVLLFTSFKRSFFWDGDGGHPGVRKKDKSTVNDHFHLWLGMHTHARTSLCCFGLCENFPIDLTSYPAPTRNPNYHPVMWMFF